MLLMPEGIFRRLTCVMLSAAFILPVSMAAADEKNTGQNMLSGMFQFYETVITPIDGDRCRMFPSCSRYLKNAVDRHGMLKGWVMGCDRLLRCGGDERRLSAPVWIDRKKHWYDPVSNNDFWWYPNE